MLQTGLAADPSVKLHDAGAGHPEKPARFDAVYNRLASTGLLQRLTPIAVRSASDDELALAHTRDYIVLTRRETAEHRRQLSTGDTDLGEHTLEAARLAAGAALSAVDAVFSGQVQNAFCLIRPPGHHASAARGMGFCVYNNIAVAARYAQQAHGAERVLIVDWDVHHGNGTQDIFYEDGSVLFFSTHQSPWYPGTGAASEHGDGKGAGTTINCPLAAGSGHDEIFAAFHDQLLPAARQFRPDVVLISAGFDSRINDPLGQFRLTDGDFIDLTKLLTDFAAEFCDNHLISLLEGGYSLEGLALASEAHVRQLSTAISL